MAMSDDMKITALARKIIVKNWFDVSRLRVRTTRGVVLVQGRIYKIAGPVNERDGTEVVMRKLDEDLHGIPRIRGVNYQLENWVSVSSGVWRKIGMKMNEAQRAAVAAGNQIG
jgi:hypothetical protein